MVVVTGAAHGIGRAVAQHLADAGRRLALVDRDGSALRGLESELERRGAARVETICVDLADAEVAEPALAHLGARLTGDGESVRAVVSGAGIGGWDRVQDVSIARWDAIVNTNLRAAFITTRAFADALQAAAPASLVYLGSDCSTHGFPRRSAYCASKHGLAGLAAAVREELREHGVRVTLLLFSRVDTGFNDGTPGSHSEVLQPGDVAGVVRWVLDQPSGVEVRQVELSAPTTSYGPG